ncbi:hypothetical protein BCS96_13665 [Vibrio breoganii]|uniref:sugar phosphate isomerase/epimerase family protein n=1 Tax=Vibrio breoganii TaxID=553239 RepID=UPI000C830EA2|nr:TIM barrel protein [Vibrio breoganii]PMF98864.1 hypothetical protein BCV02_16615 [Vibrio breoganii]PMG32326.1 hypothetical protein BCU93_00735 [Vibrio breoganii]PMG82410.1 hypothetical protein BCU81_03140 [Vibrio breoganii]PMG92148.1 hypothetical protein BCU80_11405 [Vibrio breoganii]PMK17133.1 hypothetical protein BCU06_10830 [Vibrio breoganii]
MNERFSVSTVIYSGHPIEDSFESLSRLGVQNIELALIQGAVYGLTESDVTPGAVQQTKQLLQQYEMACTSIAAHCVLTKENCCELLLKRVRVCIELSCPRLIIYAPRDLDLKAFQHQALKAFELAKDSGVRVLIENVGDRLPYMLNDSSDFEAVTQQLDNDVMGINFDPGNLLSHRPNTDVLHHSLKSLGVAEHIHLKDAVITDKGYRFCALGEGVGHYQELIHQMKSIETPFFSIECPLSLVRSHSGETKLNPIEQIPSIQEIEENLKVSIRLINQGYRT